MKQPARELLKRLGSKKAHVIGWRDMWAMATQKGGKSALRNYLKDLITYLYKGNYILNNSLFSLFLEFSS